MKARIGGIYNTSVKKVVISEGIRFMQGGSLAFSKALETVQLPESLVSIKGMTFLRML